MDINDELEQPNGVQVYPARANPHSDHTMGVVDGDTYHLVLDVGVGLWKPEDVRAEAIDTAEIYSPDTEEEREIGREQAKFARKWIAQAVLDARDNDEIPSNWPLLIRTEGKRGGYGRLLCQVYNWQGESLERAIIDEYGKEYLYD